MNIRYTINNTNAQMDEMNVLRTHIAPQVWVYSSRHASWEEDSTAAEIMNGE